MAQGPIPDEVLAIHACFSGFVISAQTGISIHQIA
jgi:hypothetical protein